MKVMIDNKEYEKLKEDVNDIKNTELLKYVKKQEESEPYISTIQHSGDDVVLKVEDTEGGGACVVTLENGEFNVTLGDETNNYLLSLTNTGDFTIQSKEGETIHSLTFDSEGNLKVDGNAVGGGTQLYQHTIWLWIDNLEFLCEMTLPHNNSINTANLLHDNIIQYYGNRKAFIGTGSLATDATTRFLYLNANHEFDKITSSGLVSVTITNVSDTIKPL